MKQKKFPDKFLKEMETRFLAEEKRLNGEISRLTEHDPFFASGRDVGNAEEMDEAEESIGHERVMVEKSALENLLVETQAALAKIKTGKYGLCEKCSAPIDPARLKIYPQARYCLDCEEAMGEEE